MTKHRKPFLVILIFSFIISVSGFIADLDERYPDIFVNIKDILVMTALIFGSLSILYLGFFLLVAMLSKKAH